MGEGYGKGYLNFLRGGRDFVLDLIPVDMVMNAMIAIMVAHVQRPSLAIYQVGSSFRNPIDEGKITDLHHQYFSKKPWIDEKGVHGKCPSPKKIVMTKSKLVFTILCAIHIFWLLALAIVDILSCHFYKVNYRQMMMQLVGSIKFSSELYRPYTCFGGIFDDKNTENLRAEFGKERGMDPDDSGFDPKSIEWDDYLLNTHIPGGGCYGHSPWESVYGHSTFHWL